MVIKAHRKGAFFSVGKTLYQLSNHYYDKEEEK